MKLLVTLLFVAYALCDSGDTYYKDIPSVDGRSLKVVIGKQGNIKFAASDSLGTIVNNNYAQYIQTELNELLGLQGTEVFSFKREEVDIGGNRHVVLQQSNRGLEVDGGELILHIRKDSGEVFAVTSSVMTDKLSEKPTLPSKVAYEALARAPLASGPVFFNQTIVGVPHLSFLIFDDFPYLVYKSLVTYEDAQGIPKKEWLYVDANNGEVVLENPLYMNALNRVVYSANGRTSLPGTLKRSEGQSKNSDADVNQAYDNSGLCYNFYKSTFNRDSIDGKGKQLRSVVHYSTYYNNAFWDGSQMVYGDGDGVYFADFAGDLSVVCHELTHAVTSYSANLRYQGESGALNEAVSDIMGAASTVYRDGGIQKDTWHIGHDCYLQGTALRYMNNPILDDSSYDWYPSRYVGSEDNGGVHWNSGIANLAFVLMTQGGVHPQDKSSIWVEDIGISQAQQIFYSALTQYMSSTTTFSGARAVTETAAKALYGVNAENTVSDAWQAVGVKP